jgi:hypothetical protein
MAQHDFNIANQGFPAFRADLNNALSAAVSLSAGATEPSTTFAYQLWYDETADILKIRNDDNDAWITLFTFDQTTNSVQVSGEELVDDTTPQLGGNLDLNNSDITGTGDINITGTVTADGLTVDTDTLYVDSTNNRVGIGTALPSDRLHVFNGSSGVSSFAANTDLIIEDSGNVGLQFASPNTSVNAIYFSDPESNTAGVLQYSHSTDEMSFDTAGATRMTIDSLGRLLIATTDTAPALNNIEGASIKDGRGEFSVDGTTPLFVNRAQDGTLVSFRSAGTGEGSISVSGTTVSFNGGHLARWSRLTDNSKDTSIVKGTVMTNLDEMVEWGDEDNEQLNKMAVSSVEGDANVAGVFVNWDEDDDWNDMNIAMTGDMVIRIASGTTVARGDLLMSAGDGTAKPQGDDIVRSKTIAKVTSTHVSHTYDDGSYLVPCVLMAC